MKNLVKNNDGFSLIELVIVIIILGVLSAVALQSFGNRINQDRATATRNEMSAIKFAIVGYDELIQNGIRTDFGFVGDMGRLPTSLDELVTQPAGTNNWNGPYIEANFQEDPNDWKIDGWGTAYTFVSLIVQSTGAGTNISTQVAPTTAKLLTNSIKVIITDRDGFSPKVADLANISVYIVLQSGTAIGAKGTANVAADGTATLANITIGNHSLHAYHSVLDQTLTYNVSMDLNVGTAIVNVIFSSLP